MVDENKCILGEVVPAFLGGEGALSPAHAVRGHGRQRATTFDGHRGTNNPFAHVDGTHRDFPPMHLLNPEHPLPLKN